MKRVLFYLTILALLLGAVAYLPAAPATAQQNAVSWKAEFFNNPYLLGDPVVTKFYDNLNLNWREGSPDPAVSTNNFSVRFTADVFFPAGTYRFQIRADDGFKLGLDSTIILDRLDNANVEEVYTVDVAVSAGVHKVQLDYREFGGLANVSMNWYNTANAPQPLPTDTAERTIPVFINANWTTQYYNNQNLFGSPVLTRIEAGPNANWGAGSPAVNVAPDSFSVRWSKVQTLNGGTYRLVVRADDGVRVWVNNFQYINEWHNASGETYYADFTLPTGTYPIIVEYYEDWGTAFIEFELLQVYDPISINPPVGQPGAPVPINTAVIINAERLNVRSSPQVTFGNIITQVSEGERYPFIARTEDGGWVQINVSGRPGWVSARYVTVTNQQVGQNPTPQPTPPPAGFSVNGVTLGEVNVRSGPSTSFNIIDRVDQGDTVSIIGRNADSSWWQVRVGGQVGWMSARWVRAETNNPASIPVVN